MTPKTTETVASYHYFDREFDTPAVKLLPNEYYVTAKDMVLATVLGSCVAACIRDCAAGIGGMNHFMLPDEGPTASAESSASMRYGAYAMEVLLNELLKAGAHRGRLEAKVFGGGAVLPSMTMLNIGERNADFVLRYLEMEHIPVTSQDLRGQLARRISYFPSTGKVLVRKLARHDDTLLVAQGEQLLVEALAKPPAWNGVELFNTAAPRRTPVRGRRRG